MKAPIVEMFDVNVVEYGTSVVTHMGCEATTFRQEGETIIYSWYDYLNLFYISDFLNQPTKKQNELLAEAKKKLVI